VPNCNSKKKPVETREHPAYARYREIKATAAFKSEAFSNLLAFGFPS
jgi:hypothetical protein